MSNHTPGPKTWRCECGYETVEYPGEHALCPECERYDSFHDVLDHTPGPWMIDNEETAERLKDTATYDLIINELIKKTANKRETKIDSEVDFFPKDDNPNHNLITEDEAIE